MCESRIIENVFLLMKGIPSSSFLFNNGIFQPASIKLHNFSVCGLRNVFEEVCEFGNILFNLERRCRKSSSSFIVHYFNCLVKKYVGLFKNKINYLEDSLGREKFNLTKVLFAIKNLFQNMMLLYRICMSVSFKSGGTNLMSDLYNVNVFNQNEVSLELFRCLSEKYLKYLNSWIYFGELKEFGSKISNDFFIKKGGKVINYIVVQHPSFAMDYFDNGFLISKAPNFLKPLSKIIFTIGQTLNIIRLYNPNHYIFWLQKGITIPEFHIFYRNKNLRTMKRIYLSYSIYQNEIHESKLLKAGSDTLFPEKRLSELSEENYRNRLKEYERQLIKCSEEEYKKKQELLTERLEEIREIENRRKSKTENRTIESFESQNQYFSEAREKIINEYEELIKKSKKKKEMISWKIKRLLNRKKGINKRENILKENLVQKEEFVKKERKKSRILKDEKIDSKDKQKGIEFKESGDRNKLLIVKKNEESMNEIVLSKVVGDDKSVKNNVMNENNRIKSHVYEKLNPILQKDEFKIPVEDSSPSGILVPMSFIIDEAITKQIMNQYQNLNLIVRDIFLNELEMVRNIDLAKEVFLCSRGDFIDTFAIICISSFKEIKDFSNLNSLLRDHYGMKFRVVKMGIGIMDCKVFEELEVEMKVDFPLNLVIDTVSISIYQEIFRFLLKLKVCLILLEGIFKQFSPSFTKNQELVHIFRFESFLFLMKLNSYFFYEVIENCYKSVKKSMIDIMTISGLKNIHNNYVRAISDGLLLNCEVISGLINGIVDFIFKFCEIVERKETLPEFEEKLEIMIKEFRRRIKCVITTLKGLKEKDVKNNWKIETLLNSLN